MVTESAVAYPYSVAEAIEVAGAKAWSDTQAEAIVAEPSPSIGDPSLADSGADKDPVAAEQVAPIEIDPPVANLYPVSAYAKAGVKVY